MSLSLINNLDVETILKKYCFDSHITYLQMEDLKKNQIECYKPLLNLFYKKDYEYLCGYQVGKIINQEYIFEEYKIKIGLFGMSDSFYDGFLQTINPELYDDINIEKIKAFNTKRPVGSSESKEIIEQKFDLIVSSYFGKFIHMSKRVIYFIDGIFNENSYDRYQLALYTSYDPIILICPILEFILINTPVMSNTVAIGKYENLVLKFTDSTHFEKVKNRKRKKQFDENKDKYNLIMSNYQKMLTNFDSETIIQIWLENESE
jgi:hypothetical protein